MKNKGNNYAYIDGANLHNGARQLGLDAGLREIARMAFGRNISIKSISIFGDDTEI